MKISKRFKLGRSQHELDFIDIDLSADIPLFLDPYLLSKRNDSWSINATRTIRSFFGTFIDLVRSGNRDKAKGLFYHLNEPNETRLGLSKGTPQGRGVGKDDAARIFASLVKSKAVATGLLKDLEDCRLFVEGIDRDKTSDMTTNIIRGHLVDYTIEQCKLWKIPLTSSVPTGFIWDRKQRKWENNYSDALVVNNSRILLVPKSIVTFKSDYTPQNYYQHFVLNFLQSEHLRLDTTLVHKRKLKSGVISRRVYKKDLKEKEAQYSKDFLATFTQNHASVFEEFRRRAFRDVKSSINEDLSNINVVDVAEHLKQELKKVHPGTNGATEYHKIVTGILEFIFYPNLCSPQVEKEIHSGRKRIDITFDNSAHEGFFFRLHSTYQTPSQFIHVECKNYSRDVKNPELDQISGRFSPNRGKVGLLLCRSIDDMERFLERCHDTYKDDRGIVLPLVDEDLISILDQIIMNVDRPDESLLMDRFRSVALR